MNRRLFLRIFGGGVLCMESGCLTQSEKSVRLCEIYGVAFVDTEHQLQVHLTDEEETVYEETYVFGETHDAFSVQGSELPVQKGQFTLRVQLDEQEWKQWFLPEFSTDSLSVGLRIKGDPVGVTLGYSPNTQC